jgi:hypothetical protein
VPRSCWRGGAQDPWVLDVSIDVQDVVVISVSAGGGGALEAVSDI